MNWIAQSARWWRGLALCSLLLGVAPVGPARADGTVPGYVLVKVKDGADVNALAAAYATTVEDAVPNRGVYSLHAPVLGEEAAFATLLGSDSRVVWAETDTYADSPEVGGSQMHFAFDKGRNPGGYVNQDAYQQIDLGAAQSLATGDGVVVAVLDTGVAFDHPALQGHLLSGFNALQPGQPPRDVPDGTTNAGVGHGTMIAGILARLAPRAQILPVRVLNGDGLGTMLDVAKGLQYAVTHGAKVINMSFGSTQPSSALNDTLDAAEAAGIVLVASAGNDNVSQPPVPASGHGTLAVASVGADNTKSSFSNYGSFIRIVAPGDGIRSAFWDGGYADWAGTSFAAPFVAAEAALVFSAHPGSTGSDVIERIRSTARSVDDVNPSYRGQLGKGIIDIAAAVAASAAPGTVAGVITLQNCMNPVQSLTITFRPTAGGDLFTRIATLAADGSFRVGNVPAGIYTLAIKGSKWLQRTLPVDTSAGSVSGVTATLLPGDDNDDNRVNLLDLGILADAFNTTPAASNWNANADFNCDGKVDIADLGILASSFNSAGDP
jgi:subtilisin family serine protease